MAADTKTKDDWPLSLPPPPKFNVPPPPIPAFVEACLHQQEQDSTVRQNGGIYNFYFKIFKICSILQKFDEITQQLYNFATTYISRNIEQDSTVRQNGGTYNFK